MRQASMKVVLLGFVQATIHIGDQLDNIQRVRFAVIQIGGKVGDLAWMGSIVRHIVGIAEKPLEQRMKGAGGHGLMSPR
ncbi:hypothetical protein H261_00625 [Paramagnetospirillum caucaseum]|uniref:Uncharacterized protein n=1 Tax=Paramagnetospirillum caucaseum TaxID=1244869 RepID=M3AGQ8_9PROT|nr:hypothetical protein H261_00625 [Paramagnetospirillum caucaseum]